MKFGYARVSTNSQKHDLQVDTFLKEGIEPKNIYADTSLGAKSERKGLAEQLSKLREGETIVVWKMDRIARSLSHLVKLIGISINGVSRKLKSKEIINFLSERIEFDLKNSPNISMKMSLRNYSITCFLKDFWN